MKSHKLIIFKYIQHILPRILLPFFRSGSQSILSVIGYPYFGLKVSVWCLWFATWIFDCLPAYPSIDWLPVLWSGSQSFQAMICFLSVVWKLVFPACDLLPVCGLEVSLSCLWFTAPVFWSGIQSFQPEIGFLYFGLEVSLSCMFLATCLWSGNQSILPVIGCTCILVWKSDQPGSWRSLHCARISAWTAWKYVLMSHFNKFP